MEGTFEHIENLVTKVGDLAETKMEILKLQGIDVVAETSSTLLSFLAIVIFGAFATLILSIGLCYIIGNALNNTGYGFLIVGVFYGLVGIILFLGRNKWLKNPLHNLLINKLMLR